MIRPSSLADCNGFRLETWIFDCFEHSSRVVGLEVPRDAECALIKNVLLDLGRLREEVSDMS